MTRSKNIYCQKNITWPKKAYGVMIPLIRESETYWLYTTYNMLVDLKQVQKVAHEFQAELMDDEDGDAMTGETVIIFELQLSRLYKMSPDLWVKEGLDFSDSSRNKMLMEAVKVPQFFEVLATYWGDSDNPFAVAAAFYKNHDADVETFMRTTNWKVDTAAKTSAIYRITKTYGYNWANDEILTAADKSTTTIN